MKILLIGGTGLISTAITKQLLERGDDVTLYNRGKSEARIPDGAKFITGDRKQYPEFEKQMQEAGHFDCVMDMVGFAPADAESVVRAFKGNIGHFIFLQHGLHLRRPCGTLSDSGKRPAPPD